LLAFAGILAIELGCGCHRNLFLDSPSSVTLRVRQCAAAGAHALNNAKNQLLDVDQPSIHFLEFTVRKADGAPNQDRPFLRA